ncbi:Glycoprotein 3-alpha-L-fucosyltransferase A [Holothuria leucospilota]|uniref:Fucosyltransferase n=1 Tax=Holothuria leucospilota TaxID=206669 RepID=A0A9Q1C402_HOLLE|nr:Glycoprotein 3-alpha-L-fucosyltransferase A [Holothuria leucospilota]
MTHRFDSDFRVPYGAYNDTPPEKPDDFVKDWTKGKTKLAAWMASNCKLTSWPRSEFVHNLSKLIPIDMFGKCGDKECKNGNECRKILRNYKFYFALENQHCRDYITEKFWYNALGNDVVPIVFGAARSEYEKVAPPHSFIHLDDFSSMEQFLDYIKLLDNKPGLYNSYFDWKKQGTVRRITLREEFTKSLICDISLTLKQKKDSNESFHFQMKENFWNDTSKEIITKDRAEGIHLDSFNFREEASRVDPVVWNFLTAITQGPHEKGKKKDIVASMVLLFRQLSLSLSISTSFPVAVQVDNSTMEPANEPFVSAPQNVPTTVLEQFHQVSSNIQDRDTSRPSTSRNPYTSLSLSDFELDGNDKSSVTKLGEKVFLYMLVKSVAQSEFPDLVLPDLKGSFAGVTPSPEQSKAHFVSVLHAPADSQHTLLDVLDLLHNKHQVGEKIDYLVVAGDGKTYHLLLRLQRMYGEELGWMLPFIGDWHLLKNSQAPLLKVYLDAGLLDLLSVFHKGSTLKAVSKASGFQKTHHFLLQCQNRTDRGTTSHIVDENVNREDKLPLDSDDGSDGELDYSDRDENSDFIQQDESDEYNSDADIYNDIDAVVHERLFCSERMDVNFECRHLQPLYQFVC